VGRPLYRDAAAGLAFGVFWFVGLWLGPKHGWLIGPHTRAGYRVAGIFTIGVLLARQTWPRTTLFLVVASYPTVYAWYSGHLVNEFHLLPVLLAAYTVARLGQLPTLWVLVAAEVPVTLMFVPLNTLWDTVHYHAVFWHLDFSRVAISQVVTAAVVLLGRATYRQSRVADELRQRHDELDRLRRLETDQVVTAERTRIARELHDVVAHHISAVVIRAQAADRVADSRPEETREAVRWIATNGQQTLAAMRQVVRVLRSTGMDSPLAPQTTLAELPQIAERLAAVGLPVELRLPEVTPILPATVELATVRIIQEALTNVLVHAKATRAMVELEVVGSEVRLKVHDDGTSDAAPTMPIRRITAVTRPPRPAPTPVPVPGLGGNGLIGMRERAASCGGVLTIGSSPLGGWMITAVLRSPLIGMTP
jgi:signal transduction histidine kinase